MHYRITRLVLAKALINNLGCKGQFQEFLIKQLFLGCVLYPTNKVT